MTVLQSESLPPEIWSLICQDPIFERFDLNSISSISHAIREEARRVLSYRFPCLQGASRVKAWCLSLRCRPHLALKIQGLVLLLPQHFHIENIILLKLTLHMCVNLKELVVLFQERHLRRTRLQEPNYSSSTHMLNDHPFKLTKFVNRYFFQDDENFKTFLKSQRYLESLELHSGDTRVYKVRLRVRRLKLLACCPRILHGYYPSCDLPNQMRLRLDFKFPLRPSNLEIAVLGSILRGYFLSNNKLTSLAILSKQEKFHVLGMIPLLIELCRPGRNLNVNPINIQHLEIHQFFPTQVCS